MTGDAGGSGNTTPAWPGFGAVYRRQPTFRWPPRPKCGRHDPGISGCMVGRAVTAQRDMCGITRRV